MQAEILKAEDIHKSYGTLEVLKGAALEVSPGEVVSIIGASGSGKSTFLRCMNLLEIPESGTLRVAEHEFRFGRQYGTPGDKSLAQLRCDVGMVFQHFNLFPHMTVLGNVVEGPIQVGRNSKAAATDHALHLLNTVGLADKSNTYPHQLSGGQKQRVAIARALAMRPKVMLFDEVTSALDPELVGEVLQVIGKLADDGMTMILVTHEMAFAADVSDRVAFMHGGLISEIGPADEIIRSPRSERLKGFLERFRQGGKWHTTA